MLKVRNLNKSQTTDLQFFKNEKECLTSRSVLPSCYSFSSRSAGQKFRTIWSVACLDGQSKTPCQFPEKISELIIFCCAGLSAKVKNG
jgi:hypothetical protein